MNKPHLTTEHIEAAIAGITEEMKGPLPNYERAILHLERKDFRKLLEERRREAEREKVTP